MVGGNKTLGVAVALFGITAMLAYTAQRLASHLGGELPAPMVIAQAHTPYYWRVLLSLFIAFIPSCLLAFLNADVVREGVARLLPVVLWPLVAAAVITLFLVP